MSRLVSVLGLVRAGPGFGRGDWGRVAGAGLGGIGWEGAADVAAKMLQLVAIVGVYLNSSMQGGALGGGTELAVVQEWTIEPW